MAPSKRQVLAQLQQTLFFQYRPQLERTIAAVKALEVADPSSETFSQALTDLHDCAVQLASQSGTVIEVIDQFTDTQSPL